MNCVAISRIFTDAICMACTCVNYYTNGLTKCRQTVSCNFAIVSSVLHQTCWIAEQHIRDADENADENAQIFFDISVI